MNKETQKKAIIIAVIVLAAVVFGIWQYQRYYERTFITIQDTDYRRDSANLDFSGQTSLEIEKLKELTALETLNLQNTGITLEQYDALHAALPACDINWSVPFQGGYVNSGISELTLEALSEADLDILAYLPELRTLNAKACTDYPEIMALIERYPDISVSYNVEIGGRAYSHTVQKLSISDPDADELMERLAYLPNVHTVDLTGELPANEALLKLQQAYPGITFVFDFEIFGVAVNTMDEFIDLSGIRFSSTEEIDAVIPHFYNLAQIDMLDCGISNDDMDALNKRYRDIKIVWRVYVCGVPLRTDALHFMPYQYNCSGVSAAACYNLRYCTDMQVLDFGHYGIGNVDFVEHMPNLKCLLMCEAAVSDLSAIGNCISLVYIELQMSPNVSNFWPLTNLTNLRDLNLSDVAYVDSSPLLQMTWLDRLWVVKNNLGATTRAMLQEALPNTIIVFQSSGHTTSGFRYTPYYYVQRDILGMYYKCN